MRIAASKQSRSAIVTAGLALAGAMTQSAHATVIASSPSLPLLDVPYVSSTGPVCFASVAVCVTSGNFTMTLPATSVFGTSGQAIDAQATYHGTLTTLSHVSIGPVNLTGTIDQLVVGRTSNTETGTFATLITGLDMSGAVLGNTLTMMLDGSNDSTGTTTIVPIEREFRIDSFFDVFVELSLDSTPPRMTSVGPILLSAGVPEPSTWAMMLLGFASLAYAGYRRARAGHATLAA
jgi:hypothetical protein